MKRAASSGTVDPSLVATIDESALRELAVARTMNRDVRRPATILVPTIVAIDKGGQTHSAMPLALQSVWDKIVKEIAFNRPLSLVRSFLHDVMSGLDYLHGRGMCHNDISPGNILLVPGGVSRGDDIVGSEPPSQAPLRFVLADFGTASTANIPPVLPSWALAPGAYRAPEYTLFLRDTNMHHLGEQIDSARADIWSVASVLVHFCLWYTRSGVLWRAEGADLDRAATSSDTSSVKDLVPVLLARILAFVGGPITLRSIAQSPEYSWRTIESLAAKADELAKTPKYTHPLHGKSARQLIAEAITSYDVVYPNGYRETSPKAADEIDSVAKIVVRMLSIDPRSRPTAPDVLHDINDDQFEPLEDSPLSPNDIVPPPIASSPLSSALRRSPVTPLEPIPLHQNLPPPIGNRTNVTLPSLCQGGRIPPPMSGSGKSLLDDKHPSVTVPRGDSVGSPMMSHMGRIGNKDLPMFIARTLRKSGILPTAYVAPVVGVALATGFDVFIRDVSDTIRLNLDYIVGQDARASATANLPAGVIIDILHVAELAGIYYIRVMEAKWGWKVENSVPGTLFSVPSPSQTPVLFPPPTSPRPPSRANGRSETIASSSDSARFSTNKSPCGRSECVVCTLTCASQMATAIALASSIATRPPLTRQKEASYAKIIYQRLLANVLVQRRRCCRGTVAGRPGPSSIGTAHCPEPLYVEGSMNLGWHASRAMHECITMLSELDFDLDVPTVSRLAMIYISSGQSMRAIREARNPRDALVGLACALVGSAIELTLHEPALERWVAAIYCAEVATRDEVLCHSENLTTDEQSTLRDAHRRATHDLVFCCTKERLSRLASVAIATISASIQQNTVTAQAIWLLGWNNLTGLSNALSPPPLRLPSK
jgi:serine/threonine protein kinase